MLMSPLVDGFDINSARCRNARVAAALEGFIAGEPG